MYTPQVPYQLDVQTLLCLVVKMGKYERPRIYVSVFRDPEMGQGHQNLRKSAQLGRGYRHGGLQRSSVNRIREKANMKIKKKLCRLRKMCPSFPVNRHIRLLKRYVHSRISTYEETRPPENHFRAVSNLIIISIIIIDYP